MQYSFDIFDSNDVLDFKAADLAAAGSQTWLKDSLRPVSHGLFSA